MNDRRTDTSFKNVLQSKSTTHGFCNCLGLAGPIDGTVGVDGSITFTVKIAGRKTSILFEGHIKTGSDMAGQFHIITVSNGQHMGEFGDWSFVK